MTRTLGNSGIEVSPIGLGCNNFGRRGTATEDRSGRPGAAARPTSTPQPTVGPTAHQA